MSLNQYILNKEDWNLNLLLGLYIATLTLLILIVIALF